MKLTPFLLDQWLNQYQHPPVDFDIAASTGPHWTVRELLALEGDDALDRLLDTELVYTHAAGTQALRAAIGAMQDVPPDHVQIVTGAAEALLILFFLAAEPNANVVIPFPCFPPMVELPRSFGLEVRQYRLRREDGFRIDMDEIKQLTDAHTKFILVNSPHNPTGAVLAVQEIRDLHDFAADRGVQFIVDEVYHPIYHRKDRPTAATLPYATVLGDFSKAFCLSGVRTGWMVEHDPQRWERYCDARAYFTVSNTAIGEALAALAVRHRETIWSKAQDTARSNLKLLERFFADHADAIDWVKPEGGMTAFPWLTSDEDARRFCEALATRGVLLVPGDCFGMPAHFRLGFAATGDRFPQALARFGDYLDGMKDKL